MPTTFNVAANPIWQLTGPNGLFLNGGLMYTYQDDARNVPKAVYQDPGGLIPYSNPIDLNSIGQTQPGPKPIYWASDKNYYVEIRDVNGLLIYFFENFNASAGGGGGGTTTVPVKNQIVNGQFTFNAAGVGSTPNVNTYPIKPISGITPIAVQWDVLKNNANATETIQFINFVPGTITPPANPIQYLSYVCTGAGTSETNRDVRAHINKSNSFETLAVTISFWAISSTTSSIQVFFTQYFGTGGTPSANVETSIDTISLTNVWTKYTRTLNVVPSTGGKTVGTNLDDEVWLGFRLPLNTTFNVGLVNVQLQIGNSATDYDYRNFQIEKALSFGQQLPDPGQFATEVFTPTDPNNGGLGVMTLGFPDIFKTINVGSNNLYNLNDDVGQIIFWPMNVSAPNIPDQPYALPQGNYLFCDGRTLDGYTNNYKYYRLGIKLGRTWLSGNDGYIWNSLSVSPNLQFNNQQFGAITQAADVNSGLVITTPVPGGVSTRQMTQIVCKPASQITAGTYFTVNRSSGQYYVWFLIDNAGTDPLVPGKVGIPVPLLSTYSASTVYFAIMRQLSAARFALPPINQGLFIRGGPVLGPGTNYDPDFISRQTLDINNPGSSGNSVGSFQSDQFKSHNHSGSTGNATFKQLFGGGGNGAYTGSPPSDLGLNISPDGGNQTNPANIYIAAYIKY